MHTRCRGLHLTASRIVFDSISCVFCHSVLPQLLVSMTSSVADIMMTTKQPRVDGPFTLPLLLKLCQYDPWSAHLSIRCCQHVVQRGAIRVTRACIFESTCGHTLTHWKWSGKDSNSRIYQEWGWRDKSISINSWSWWNVWNNIQRDKKSFEQERPRIEEKGKTYKSCSQIQRLWQKCGGLWEQMSRYTWWDTDCKAPWHLWSLSTEGVWNV